MKYLYKVGDTWRSDDYGFEAEFPVTPVETPSSRVAGTRGYSWVCLHDKVKLVAGINAVSVNANNFKIKDIVESVEDKIISQGGVIESREDVYFAGMNSSLMIGRVPVPQDEMGRICILSFFDSGNIYEISTLTPYIKNEESEAAAKRFVSSFKLIERKDLN